MLTRRFTTLPTLSSASLCIASALIACGNSASNTEEADAAPSSADITGRYNNVELESGPCGALTPSTLAPPFLLVDSLQTTYYVRGCQSLNDTDCPSLYYDFTTPIEGGWAAAGGTSFYSGECTLTWERSQATLANGVLSVHTLRYQATGGVAEADCNLASAEALTICSSESLLTAAIITP